MGLQSRRKHDIMRCNLKVTMIVCKAGKVERRIVRRIETAEERMAVHELGQELKSASE